MSIQDLEKQARVNSEMALAWLTSHPRRWKTCISNRTSKILEFHPTNCSQYIPSEQIPAGILSCRINPQYLVVWTKFNS
ncbi:hypothetical protein CEXT_3231 [Caerostris extrusa]|uniref:Uncharacterized protein n=1 Tax=Caerostris extrusa TaxID=172846 RepID=A0AAV4SFT1_CAEEX|nr:hypothetical protein CEXT_3231 [Caerostris extrusa]